MSDLDARLLAAHAAGDKAALVTLYRQAAEAASGAAEAASGAAATGFFLTQAYVFALDTGHPEASRLHARLVDMGREA